VRERAAACACGALRLTARGAPRSVAACNCLACQRRTGSVFGVNAYFPADAVTTSGEAKTFERGSARKRALRLHFCPDCGTTLWLTGEFAPGVVGVPVGCFADPDFPPPERAVWTANRHAWVRFPEDCLLMDEQTS